MRWRDILIGAFITLVVTVVGGIIVYYVTKSPTHEPPSEKLVYQADTAAKFTSESRKLSFQQIRVANVGTSVAQEVIIGISFSKKTKILDNSVALTSGPAAGEYTVKKENDNTVKIAVPTLAPSEAMAIALLVDVDEPESPTVAVKSNKTIGVNQPIEKQQQPQKESRKKAVDNVMTFLMPLLIFAQIFIVKRFRHEIGGTRSVNNLAFMYIHKGMYGEAKQILRNNIYSRGADAYELVNYGFCLGLDGEKDKAEKNFEAAEFYAPGSSIKGLIQFYKGIISYNEGEKVKAKTYFETALQLSNKKIKRYAKFSELMVPIYSEDQAIKQLFGV